MMPASLVACAIPGALAATSTAHDGVPVLSTQRCNDGACSPATVGLRRSAWPAILGADARRVPSGPRPEPTVCHREGGGRGGGGRELE
ncbi:hypothetical protein T484DRAFT_1927635 [Baffinella frigidus]|nr:hypothetical protein T484DRAFT_1927635 [Cryptophyta sp. CCMP2293]